MKICQNRIFTETKVKCKHRDRHIISKPLPLYLKRRGARMVYYILSITTADPFYSVLLGLLDRFIMLVYFV